MHVHPTKRFRVLDLNAPSPVQQLVSSAVVATPATSVPATTPAPTAAPIDIEALILSTLHTAGSIADSFEFAAQHGIDHQALVGTLKSLLADNYCLDEPITSTFWTLTEEGSTVVTAGSPEFQVFSAVPAGGINMKELQDALGEVAKIGLGACMKSKWVVKKGEMIERAMDAVVDETAALLSAVSLASPTVPEEELKNLKKRKLVQQITRKSYRITQGPNFRPQRVRKHADLTKEMLGNAAEVRVESPFPPCVPHLFPHV